MSFLFKNENSKIVLYWKLSKILTNILLKKQLTLIFGSLYYEIIKILSRNYYYFLTIIF